jgi:hypothetical protein
VAELAELEAESPEDPEPLLEEPVVCEPCPPLPEPDSAGPFWPPEVFSDFPFEESDEPFWFPDSDSPECSLARESVR